MELQIKLRPHVTLKQVFGKTVEKSFNQDFVDLLGDDGKWRHIGYYSYPAKCFSGLVNWDNSLNDLVTKEIEKIKGVPVSFADAPQDDPELTEVYEDDESD